MTTRDGVPGSSIYLHKESWFFLALLPHEIPEKLCYNTVN